MNFVKKAIGLGLIAWTFKLDAMNSDTLPTPVGSGQYTQRLEAQYPELAKHITVQND